METIHITKIQVAPEAVTVDYTRQDGATPGETVHKECQAIPHADLLAAFRRLAPHLAILAEVRGVPADFVEGLAEYDDRKLLQLIGEGVKVHGVTIRYGAEDARTVKISGSKSAELGAIAFKSPAVLDSGNTKYPYAAHLGKAIDALTREVRAYLFEGKAAIVQGNLFDGKTASDPQTPASAGAAS